MQPTYRRYVGSFLLGAALIAPAGLRAGVYQQDDRHQDDRRRENKHDKRYYDRDHKDYHDWDDREESAYRNWRQERNENPSTMRGGMMTTNIDNRPGFLNVHEVAKLLNCSPRSVYNWISQNTIPYRKAGRRVLFDESEIRNWTKPNSGLHRAPILTRR